MIKKFVTYGETYDIEIDEDTYTIHVRQAGKHLGKIELDERQDDFSGEFYYHICHLALEACKGRGIGQACLEFHKEIYGGLLTAARPNSGELPDGSQLIGDGIPFIARMRAKKIVAPIEDLWDEHVAPDSSSE
jgi:hypothetical protein